MKKRRLLRLGLLAGLGLFGFWFVLWWTAPEHRICKPSFDRISVGMTMDEVIGILRAPPGEFTTYNANSVVLFWHVDNGAAFPIEVPGENVNRRFKDGSIYRAWISDNAAIAIRIDAKEKVVDAHFHSFDEDWPSRIRRWLFLS